MNPSLFFSALSVSLVMASAAFAADEYNVANGLTLNGNPLGMHGVDSYFASAEAKLAVDADPDAYLPQFGGFCAFGVYVGKKLDGDVRYADLVEGKL